VVSKKVSPLAVSRNSLRRRIYAAVRGKHPRSTDLIIFPNKNALTASFASLSFELEKIVRS